MSGKTIYHLQFHSGAHHYFGSITAIFDLFDASTLKVSRSRLYDHGMTPDKPYRNSVCTIRKGIINRKKTNRGKTNE